MRVIGDVAENLKFFTRLPLGGEARAPDFARIGYAAPLAGACVGALGAAAFALSRGLGLPDIVAATLAVAVEAAATGALHEDGLADLADGFGGGRDRAAKLAIMRDSRLGTYGAVALALVLALRVEALAAAPSTLFAAAALLLSGAAARFAALVPLARLRPARADGAGAGAGVLGSGPLAAAAATLIALSLALGWLELSAIRALAACLAATLSAEAVAALARRQIGGQTGDVCGAAAAVAEVVTLLSLLIGAAAA